MHAKTISKNGVMNLKESKEVWESRGGKKKERIFKIIL